MKIIDGMIYSEHLGGTDGGKVVPMPHPNLLDHYRVPLYKELIPHTQYTIYVGKGLTRIYTDETLPPFISSRMTMANAMCDDVPSDETIISPLDLFKDGWSSNEPKYDIAWRVSTSVYVIVMTKVELFELRGDV